MTVYKRVTIPFPKDTRVFRAAQNLPKIDDQGGIDYPSIYRWLLAYCNTPKAQLAAPLRPYLPDLRAGEAILREDMHFKVMLQEAQNDPVVESNPELWQYPLNGIIGRFFQAH